MNADELARLLWPICSPTEYANGITDTEDEFNLLKFQIVKTMAPTLATPMIWEDIPKLLGPFYSKPVLRRAATEVLFPLLKEGKSLINESALVGILRSFVYDGEILVSVLTELKDRIQPDSLTKDMLLFIWWCPDIGYALPPTKPWQLQALEIMAASMTPENLRATVEAWPHGRAVEGNPGNAAEDWYKSYCQRRAEVAA